MHFRYKAGYFYIFVKFPCLLSQPLQQRVSLKNTLYWIKIFTNAIFNIAVCARYPFIFFNLFYLCYHFTTFSLIRCKFRKKILKKKNFLSKIVIVAITQID